MSCSSSRDGLREDQQEFKHERVPLLSPLVSFGFKDLEN